MAVLEIIDYKECRNIFSLPSLAEITNKKDLFVVSVDKLGH